MDITHSHNSWKTDNYYHDVIWSQPIPVINWKTANDHYMDISNLYHCWKTES